MKLPAKVLSLAIATAAKSPMKQRHGAVIWKSGVILGAGYNFFKQPPNEFKRILTIHSERAALAGLRHDQMHGASILAVRIAPGGGLSYGAPCIGCQRLLSRRGLAKAYWFDSLGQLNCTYFK